MPTVESEEPDRAVRDRAKCLVPDCTNAGSWSCKGMCVRCWGQAKLDIAGGKVTEDQLAEMGLIERTLTPYQRAIKSAQKKGG